jgi:hypothetical protein
MRRKGQQVNRHTKPFCGRFTLFEDTDFNRKAVGQDRAHFTLMIKGNGIDKNGRFSIGL